MVTTYPAENYYWESRGDPEPVEGDFFKVWENALRWTAQNRISSTPLTKPIYKQISTTIEDKRPDQSGGGRDF